MSLALLTLGLLCARPAQAQQDPGHYWKITYSNVGTASYAVPDQPAPGQSTAYSNAWTNTGAWGLESEININGNVTGTITATLTWVPAAGKTLQSDPPSEPVSIVEQSTAEESPANWNGPAPAPVPAGSASDGLGDPQVRWNSGYISSGVHLIQKDGSTGTIAVPCSLSSVNPTSTYQTGGYPGGGYPGGGGGYSYWDWTGGLCVASFGVAVCPFGITADTNRDGVIDAKDEAGKGAYTKTSGAIFSVNYDYDDARITAASSTKLPDVVYFGDDATSHYLNNVITLTADTKDIAPFIIRSPGSSLPTNYHLFLKASAMQDIQAVYIYKNIAAQEKAIWGGPTETNQEIDITPYVSSSNGVTFGIEGLLFKNDKGKIIPYGQTQPLQAFNGLVTLTLEMRDPNGVAVGDDTIQLKVAPWMILPDSQPSLEVWAEDKGAINASFLSTLAGSGQLHKQLYDPTPVSDMGSPVCESQWFMDQIKIGYTQRPGGPVSHEVFRQPYGSGTQYLWPLNDLLTSNVGVFQIGAQLLTPSSVGISGDFGGNLGALSPTPAAPLGQIVMGTTRSQQLHDFLVSQEVQPYVEINTSWLGVGHVDEVVGFTSASTVALADPADAYNLLNNLPGSAVFFSTDSTPPATGAASMASATNTTTLVTNNITWSGTDWQYIRIYSGTGAGQVGLIAPGGITINGTSATITVSEVWNTGSKIVDGDNQASNSTAAYALGYRSAPASSSGWFLNISPADSYVLVKGTKNWVCTSSVNGNQLTTETPAIVTVQEVLADSSLNTVNLTDVPTQRQSIEATLNTAAGAGTINFISVSTIYAGVHSLKFGAARSAVALTPGLANVQEIGTKLYFPKQFGPRDANGNDVFEKETLTRYPNAVFVDDWDLYHRLQGEVHCGTAMKRQPFSFNWWEKQP